MMNRLLESLCLLSLTLLLACPLATQSTVRPSTDGKVDEIHVLEGVPRPGTLTVMSRWIDRKYRPAAVVFDVNDQGDIMAVIDRKGEQSMWKGLIDRYCRSDHAFAMVARMVERIPERFGVGPVTEADLFTYLPFIHMRQEIHPLPYTRVRYGNLPGYCRICSNDWHERIGSDRIAVLDRHDDQGRFIEGYILEFSEGHDAGNRFLEAVYRAEGLSHERIWPARGASSTMKSNR